MSDISTSPSWQQLEAHRAQLHAVHLRQLFAADSMRFQRFSLQHDGLLVDFSKQRIVAQTVAYLLELAHGAELPKAIERLFRGEKVNSTEERPALHTALRSSESITVDDSNVHQDVHYAQEKMRIISERVRRGDWPGSTDAPINTVVNIGIGGSDLGPRLVCEALASSAHPLTIHFVANVDPAEIGSVLSCLNPHTTLFVITSKTFTTQETSRNAHTAREWLRSRLGATPALDRHFLAITNNKSEALRFGVDADNILPLPEWVGGRYSLWSAAGLAIAMYLGWDDFVQLLAGAASIDQHFRATALDRNIPALLGLLDVWNINFLGAAHHLVIPYSQRLARLPAYLQQLVLESNGKSVRQNGTTVSYSTAQGVWGEPGTNAQHAFFQWLHQGTSFASVDFIAAIEGRGSFPEHQEILLANLLAQSQALMQGKTANEAERDLIGSGLLERDVSRLTAHKTFAGNRPSTTILIPELNAFHLGQLLCLYEHRVFIQGVIWDINSFDQWGVELGKTLARPLLQILRNQSADAARDLDASTRGLLAHIQAQWRSKSEK